MDGKGLRNGAIFTFIAAMILLLAGGYYAKDRVPPIPEQVRDGDRVLMTRDDILSGQDVYQRYGLMDHGSVWGHGSLRGSDFSASTLHLIGEAMRDYAVAGGDPSPDAYEELSPSEQKATDAGVIEEMHVNRYNPETATLELTPGQAHALELVKEHWEEQLGTGNARYGFLKDTVPTADEREAIAGFFFWTAWASGTDRPGEDFTYTNNWPPDRSVGNVASAEAFIWSIASILALFLVLGVVIYVIHRYQFFYGPARGVEAAQQLMHLPVTPSQRASAKFLLLSGLLFLVQIFNGGLLAHYTVHPGSFYIKFIGETYPYSWAKSWHLQLAILWIAISWIGTAIYLAPLIARREPKGQRFLVNLLFVAVLIVGVGSLLGEVLGIKGLLGRAWFWLGHQGWEYLELGRLWQILLFAGLIFWLVIVYRALVPAFRNEQEHADRRSLVLFYVFSAVFVVGFFGFGLFYGRGTHLTIADYWRWFVVHIWVESIFEFFGVAVIALFLVTLGLVTARSALHVAYLTAILVFLGGIPGTAHHYFWYGGPSLWLAMGGVFSSLEPVPLIVLVVRAWMEYRHIREAGKEFPYRWPLYFLTASSFWNFLGAGIFGFMINLPIINYYEHATYLTANHAHSALFGVYGMLAIALILFSWRGLVDDKHWNDGILKLSFWGLNAGLFIMVVATLLPVGLLQTWHSYSSGFWYARSADFYELPFVQTLGNWRIVPDAIIILLGAVPLLYFLVTTFPRLRRADEEKVA
ncbi:MAG: nitric-oxide reductase large subunit [Planctomycetota bacterium]|jgi:nitric oxide reductase subunit B